MARGPALVRRAADLAGLTALPVLTDDEYERQVVRLNETRVTRPWTTVAALVGNQIAARPDAVAVVAGDRSLTYRELGDRAVRLAAELRAAGVGPEVAVAVGLPRTPELIVGLLGVLLTGGYYVPVDPDQPVDRTAWLLADSAAAVLLTTTGLAYRWPAASRVVMLDERAGPPAEPTPAGPAPAPVRPDNLVYVMYTSGSTGRPKGVAITHAGLGNLVAWHLDRYRIGPADRTSQVAAVGFDASAWEIWPALAAGAQLHIAGEEERLRPDRLLLWLTARQITVAFLPTPLAEQVLREPAPPTLALRTLLTGGDRLRDRPRIGAGYELVNHYGPTEASVVTTAAPIAPSAPGEESPPAIGGPIDNMRTYVLDHHLRPVPAGVPGELYIAGVGLARGYLGQPGRTAERFVPDPFAAGGGGRLYRTGDLVRVGERGTIEFLHRLDRQVQIRGLRVECGEVEARLRELPSVRDAVVAARDDARGEVRLVGYVTPLAGQRLDVAAVREQLARQVPGYMVPAAILALDEWPISANGKIDVSRLPDPAASAADLVGPRDEVEAVVAATWAEVLELPADQPIDVHQSFIALGGHSLLAHQVITRLNSTFDLDLSVATLFRAPTVASLAATLQEHDESGRIPTIARLSRDVQRLSDEDVARMLEELGVHGHNSDGSRAEPMW